MKERIRSWYVMDNNHPLDNERFFDIVIDSIMDKIGVEVFREALMEVNPEITEDKILTIYNRYEMLWTFLKYYITRRNANNQN